MCPCRHTVFSVFFLGARFKLSACSYNNPAEETLPTLTPLHQTLERNTIHQTPCFLAPMSVDLFTFTRRMFCIHQHVTHSTGQAALRARSPSSHWPAPFTARERRRWRPSARKLAPPRPGATEEGGRGAIRESTNGDTGCYLKCKAAVQKAELWCLE